MTISSKPKPTTPRNPGIRQPPLTGWSRRLALLACATPMIVCVLGLIYLSTQS